MNEQTSLNALTELTRKEKFELWKSRSGRTSAELARMLGISGSAFCVMINGETMPAWHHKDLLGFGVPEDCLPRPVVNKKGTRPEGYEYQGGAS